jgi:drug/metabolite transporter superfamily protein YnfA
MTASIFGTLTNVIIVGLVWAVCGAVILQINKIVPTMGLSQDAMIYLGWFEIAYASTGIIFLIASIINLWIVAKSEASMGV